MEKVLGIEKSRRLPTFHRRTFASWMSARGTKPADPTTSVTLFYSCSVNYNEPQVGRDAVSVLERNGCVVKCPAQVCCGMPFLDGGDIESARRDARKNVGSLKAAAARGEKILVPQPTCSYVLMNEYPLLVPGDDAKGVAAVTMDIFEYLASRNAEGTLNTEFPGKAPGRVSYQMPCHLRAQNMGFKARDVLQTVPGTAVSVIEKCTAMDGTWGMKKEYFPISMQFAKRAVKKWRRQSRMCSRRTAHFPRCRSKRRAGRSPFTRSPSSARPTEFPKNARARTRSKASLGASGSRSRLTANNGRYRGEAEVTPSMGQELLRDLGKALQLDRRVARDARMFG